MEINAEVRLLSTDVSVSHEDLTESLKFEALHNDISNGIMNVPTKNCCATAFRRNNDLNLALKEEANIQETKRFNKRVYVGRKQRRAMNQRRRDAEDVLNGCKPFSIRLTRLPDVALKRLSRYRLRTRSVMPMYGDKSRARRKHSVQESRCLQNENYSEKRDSQFGGSTDKIESVNDRIEISNNSVNYQCKVKRPLLDKNIYEPKESQAAECVKRQGLSDVVSIKRNENTSEVNTKLGEYNLKASANKVDHVEILETSNNAEIERTSIISTGNRNIERKEQGESNSRDLQKEETEYTDYIKNFLMERLHTVSGSAVFSEKYDAISDKNVVLSKLENGEEENEGVIAWKYKRKRSMSDSEDSGNEEMNYGKQRKLQEKYKINMTNKENAINISNELNNSTMMENLQTVYLSNAWNQQDSEKKLRDFIKANSINDLKVDLINLKDMGISSVQIRDSKDMPTMNNCIIESQLRLLSSSESFSQSIMEHGMLKNFLSVQPFNVTSHVPNSNSKSFNLLYKVDSSEVTSSSNDFYSKVILNQRCIKDKESSLEDDKKYNAKVSQLNWEASLKAKYEIIKEPIVFLLRLDVLKNNCSNKYSVSEIESLMKKYNNALANVYALSRNLVNKTPNCVYTPQSSKIINDLPHSTSKTEAACESVSNYPTISHNITENHVIRISNDKPLVTSKTTGQLKALKGQLSDNDTLAKINKTVFVSKHVPWSSDNTPTINPNVRNIVTRVQSVVGVNTNPKGLQLESSNDGTPKIDESNQKNSFAPETFISMEQNTSLEKNMNNHPKEISKSQTDTEPSNHIDSDHSIEHVTSLCNNRCKVCQKDFENKDDLSKHSLICRFPLKDSSSLSKYTCNCCGRKYLKEKPLQLHLRTKHNRSYDEPTNYDCNVCSETFKSKECLSEHIFKHTSKELQAAYRLALGKQNLSKINQLVKGANSKDGCAQKSTNEGNTKLVRKICAMPRALNNVTNKEFQIGNVTYKVVEKSALQSSASNSAWTMCRCHQNEVLVDPGSLLIEIGIFCRHCKVFYRRKQCYEVHLLMNVRCLNGRSVHKKPQMFCNACHILLDSLPDMRNHLGIHQHLNLNYMVTFLCHICKVVFFGLNPLFYTHWYYHSRNSDFVASSYFFPSSVMIRNPLAGEFTVKIETGMGKGDYLLLSEYFCSQCNLPCSNSDNLRKHRAKSCSETIEAQPILLDCNIMMKLICSFCKVLFTSKFMFDEHLSAHKTLQKVPSECTFILTASYTVYICNACGTEFTNISKFEEHWMTHRMAYEKFCCEYCDKLYDTLEEFLDHSETHLFVWSKVPVCTIVYETANYCCATCKLGFESQDTFDRHSLFHNNIVSNNIASNKSSNELIVPECEGNTISCLTDNINVGSAPKIMSPRILEGSVVQIKSLPPSSSQEEILSDKSLQENAITEIVTSVEEDCMDGTSSSSVEVDNTTENEPVQVLMMDHDEVSNRLKIVDSLNDYIIPDSSAPVTEKIDSSKSKLEDIHMVILNQDQSSCRERIEVIDGSTGLIGTGEVNNEEQIMVEQCPIENDPLAISSIVESDERDNDLIVDEDVEISTDSNDTTLAESKFVHQRPSVIKKAPPIVTLKEIENERVPKQTFLRVKSLTELQEMKLHACSVCQRRFNSSKNLKKHFQEHAPSVAKDSRNKLQSSNINYSVTDDLGDALNPTPEVPQVSASNANQEAPSGGWSTNTDLIRYSNFVDTTKRFMQKLNPTDKNNLQPLNQQDGSTTTSALSKPLVAKDKQIPVQLVCPSCCDFQHVSADEFRIHLTLCQGKRQVQQNKPIQIKNCSVIVAKKLTPPVPDPLFLHEQREAGSNKRIYGCNACPNFKCTTGLAMSQHLKWHAARKTVGNAKKYCCKYCSHYATNSKETLKRHEVIHLKQMRKIPKTEVQPSTETSRKHCSKSRPPPRKIKVGNRIEGSGQVINDTASVSDSFSNVSYKCRICNTFEYSSYEELLSHLLNAHANSSNNCYYVCDYCPHHLAFSMEETLRSHVDTFHNYVCKSCSQRCSSISELESHELSHNASTETSYGRSD